MGAQDLSKLRAGLNRDSEIRASLAGLNDTCDFLEGKMGASRLELERIQLRTPYYFPSSLTKKEVEEFLVENDMPSRGNKEELLQIVRDNGLVTEILETSIRNSSGEIGPLQIEVLEEELKVKPYQNKKLEADRKVEKSKKSWVYSLDKEDGIATMALFGWLICFGLVLLIEPLQSEGIISDDDEEADLGNPIEAFLYLSFPFFCCFFPYMGPVFLPILMTVFDPASSAVELQNSAESELRVESKNLHSMRSRLKQLKKKEADAEEKIREFLTTHKRIDNMQNQMKMWEDEIGGNSREILKLEMELEQNYASISHLIPYSYMLE